jgi:hypothetical protein
MSLSGPRKKTEAFQMCYDRVGIWSAIAVTDIPRSPQPANSLLGGSGPWIDGKGTLGLEFFFDASQFYFLNEL